VRRSAESVGSGTTAGGAQGFTPTSEEEMAAQQAEAAQKNMQKQQQSSGGGWWGGIIAMGSAAVKQAGEAVKEIQKNEEAQRWAEQMRGNVGVLKGFGMF
jgi:uncharacterized protein DUF2427